METTQVHLARRPTGMPQPSDFELVRVPVPEPAHGEVVVENAYLSVDPYMRGRMTTARSYIPPFEVGAPLEGGAVGRVVASRAEGLAVGDAVRHMLGWREHAWGPASAFRRIDADAAPLEAYLGVLGMPGMTAYVGLHDVAQAKEGEVVYVSGAAGAVGSTAGQIARVLGCRVVGSAGSPEKVAYLRDELGFDAAFDYHDGPVRERLKEQCPDGIDVVFENVGGESLAAALTRMRPFGRVAVCGLISSYNATAPEPGPPLWPLVRDRITLRGFLVGDFGHRTKDFYRDVSAWVADGRVRERRTVVEGIERMPDAFIGLFTGENIGKMLVAVRPS